MTSTTTTHTRPFEVRWATSQAIEQAHAMLTQFETLLTTPADVRDETYPRELQQAWSAVLNTRSTLARSLRSLQPDTGDEAFVDHTGRTCSRDEAVENFLVQLPPVMVPEEGAHYAHDWTGAGAAAWHDLLQRCQPVFQECDMEIPATTVG